MNLPNIPTDNLYKFLAIAGLVILISSNALYIIFGGRIMNTAQEWLRIGAVNTFEKQIITADINTSKRKIAELEKSLQAANPSEKQILSEQVQAEKNILKSGNAKLEDISKNFVSMNNSINTDWFKTEVAYVKWTLILGNIIGTVATITGFYLWYTKLQKYQDKMIKQKAAKG